MTYRTQRAAFAALSDQMAAHVLAVMIEVLPGHELTAHYREQMLRRGAKG